MISLLIAVISAALTYPQKTSGSSYYSTTAAYFLDASAGQPAANDNSEIGSTDGLIVMSGIIVIIVLIPILIQRRSWMHTD
jgi:hypothetical protein